LLLIGFFVSIHNQKLIFTLKNLQRVSLFFESVFLFLLRLKFSVDSSWQHYRLSQNDSWIERRKWNVQFWFYVHFNLFVIRIRFKGKLAWKKFHFTKSRKSNEERIQHRFLKEIYNWCIFLYKGYLYKNMFGRFWTIWCIQLLNDEKRKLFKERLFLSFSFIRAEWGFVLSLPQNSWFIRFTKLNIKDLTSNTRIWFVWIHFIVG